MHFTGLTVVVGFCCHVMANDRCFVFHIDGLVNQVNGDKIRLATGNFFYEFRLALYVAAGVAVAQVIRYNCSKRTAVGF
jgi:hypothetical protein